LIGASPPLFTAEEYQQRVQRVQRSMASQGLDALLVTTEMNFRYFSGLHFPGWVNPTRPFFLIIPVAGSPLAVVPSPIVIPMHQGSWISDVRTWPAPRPDDDGVTLLRDSLQEVSRESAQIGAELGPQTQMRMPLLDYLKLEKAIAPRAFVDASALILRLRMAKSPAELARIRTAARITSHGFASLPMCLRPGMTERDACRELQIELLRNGIERASYIAADCGPGGYETISAGPTTRVLKAGDVLYIDISATVDGYYCDFNRNFGFDTIDDRTKRAHDLTFAATEAGISAARAGRTVSSVWRAMAAELGIEAVRGASVGRMGHGVGLALAEPPSIHPDDETVLEPGMVIAIEPGIAYEAEDGSPRVMVHEENVAITNGAAELLSSRAPSTIPLIKT
jgi:Xaa-Pro dipeptidase